MRFEITRGDKLILNENDHDFETAYEHAIAHAETVNWSDEFDYILTEENGQKWAIEMDAWTKIVDINSDRW